MSLRFTIQIRSCRRQQVRMVKTDQLSNSCYCFQTLLTSRHLQMWKQL